MNRAKHEEETDMVRNQTQVEDAGPEPRAVAELQDQVRELQGKLQQSEDVVADAVAEEAELRKALEQAQERFADGTAPPAAVAEASGKLSRQRELVQSLEVAVSNARARLESTEAELAKEQQRQETERQEELAAPMRQRADECLTDAAAALCAFYEALEERGQLFERIRSECPRTVQPEPRRLDQLVELFSPVWEHHNTDRDARDLRPRWIEELVHGVRTLNLLGRSDPHHLSRYGLAPRRI